MYLGGPYLLTHAGQYLITQDPLVKADMALVLSGQPHLCVPEAARLYHEGLVPKILLVNEPRPPGQDDLLRLGIRYPDGLEISLQLLEALRVPREAILTIPERADGLHRPRRTWNNLADVRQTVWEYAALVDLWRRGLWRAVVGEATLVPPAVTVR